MPEPLGTSTAYRAYWDQLFADGEVIQADHDLTITIDAALHPRRRVMLLHQDGLTRAALTPEVASLLSLQSGAHVGGAASGPPVSRQPARLAQRLPLPSLRARLSDAGVVLHSPDRIFYYPVGTEPWLVTEGEPAVRQLSERDQAAFAAFQAEAPEQDKEDAFVELDHWAVFGVFEQDRLVSAASMYPWDNAAIADLGVLTLSAYRGKGYAKALVRSSSRHALRLGYQPQYRCQLDNQASTALAQAAGLSFFGTWEVAES